MIIGAIIIVVICAITAYFLVFNNQQLEYTTLQVSNTCSLQVPVSNDVENATDSYGIVYYQDKEHNLNITSFNSQEGVALSGGIQMASLRDSQQLNCQVVVENGTSIYFNKDTGIYTIFIGNNNTHDNILISTPDKDLLLTIVNSVNYGGDVQDNNTTESLSVNSVSSSTSNNAKDSSSSTISSDSSTQSSNEDSSSSSESSDGYEYSSQYEQDVKVVNDGIVDRENNYLVQERNGHSYDSEGYQID